MNKNLSRRLALVTGSSRGLGKAIAVTLAMEGADVIINGRNHENVDQTVREFKRYHPYTLACYADATKPQEIKDFFHANSIWINKLDILVNNVGNIEKFGGFEDLDEEDWQRSFDLTLMSAVRFIKASLPCLRKSNQARIINISSLPAHQPGYFNPHYSAAKAAMLNLTKHLANSLGKDRILVNAICPSTLDGGGWDQNIKDRAKRDGLSLNEAENAMRSEENKKSPLCRMGTVEDVANMVAYLASDKAGFMTGEIINIDGGITRGL